MICIHKLTRSVAPISCPAEMEVPFQARWSPVVPHILLELYIVLQSSLLSTSLSNQLYSYHIPMNNLEVLSDI